MRRLCIGSLFLLFGLPTELASGVCELPVNWAGDWFESGVREGVNITLHELSHKGTCLRSRQNNQFIFKDRNEGCLRCLSMHEKHENILQYKESKCVSDRNQKQLCQSIAVDEPLRTLFRLRSSSEQCPLTGHFTFSYSRGYGLCAYPLSSLSQCGNGSSLVFRYQACPDIKGSESGLERAHCIASWREGSTDYFVARLQSSQSLSSDRETGFRCFVYKKNYSGFQLSMSGAAECNLYTATEGHTTFNINKLRDTELECEYPAWFRKHRKYINLQEDHQLHLNHRGSVLTLRTKKELSSAPPWQDLEPEELRNLECSRINQENQNITQMVALSTKDCESGFQCVEVEQVSENVVLLRVGRLTHSPDDACNPHLFFNLVQPILFTSVHLPNVACPFSGQYQIKSGDFNSSLGLTGLSTPSWEPEQPVKCPYLVSSCLNPHTLSFSRVCSKHSQDFVCHDSWDTAAGRKVVLSNPQNSANRFCLLVNRTKDDLSVAVLSTCTESTDTQTSSTTTFLGAYHGDCSPTALATANSGAVTALSPTIFASLLLRLGFFFRSL